MSLIVGVFSPAINWCGGAEWVAVNIIDALKENGHQVIVLSDSPLNQSKFQHIFNKKVHVDQQVVFPLRFFSPTNYHNVYTDSIRSLLLKSKCKVLIDTFSNALLPGVDCCYIHYPLLKRMENRLPYMRNKIFFHPYKSYLRLRKNKIKSLFFANSRFSAEAIRAEIGVVPHVLYPSVSNEIFKHSEIMESKQRPNTVLTIARICPQKRLEIIPQIAELTSKEISFTIVGLLDSKRTLKLLLKTADELGVSERVKIMTNVRKDQLIQMLLKSKAYLHTSIEEHFGISIVEAMAAGCIPIVHNSGGPKEFVPSNQRFNTIYEAADIVEKSIDSWSPARAKKFAEVAERFSEKNFRKQFIDIFHSHFLRR